MNNSDNGSVENSKLEDPTTSDILRELGKMAYSAFRFLIRAALIALLFGASIVTALYLATEMQPYAELIGQAIVTGEANNIVPQIVITVGLWVWRITGAIVWVLIIYSIWSVAKKRASEGATDE